MSRRRILLSNLINFFKTIIINDKSVVKLENSINGNIIIQEIQGNTVILDSDGNITDTVEESCILASVGEQENNNIKIRSTNCPIEFGKGGRL